MTAFLKSHKGAIGVSFAVVSGIASFFVLWNGWLSKEVVSTDVNVASVQTAISDLKSYQQTQNTLLTKIANKIGAQ